ncbi:acyl-[acyl-carrier-protein] thioesterase [Mariniradius sediminis]|uniref:Thioesterase n=1 Tax=Mariniradius sediminis TaxID=2909237 RepID=A0ABS9BYL9_9BACT|nr:acyl-ACP thioesterase domain-containing protein [Mariniradius sediminis]MCF1752857.1 thioesterase [Mariniradius sediminis]
MPTNQPFQYSKEFEVLSFQVDPKGNLRWASLGDLLQEVAWKHADSRDFGQALFDKGLVWVLSRFHIEVKKMPRWGDKIRVETAGRGVSKLFALREFSVSDVSGNQLAWAMSAWLLLDINSKRPQRPAAVLPSELFDPIADENIVPSRVEIPLIQDHHTRIKVLPSDLDMNNHVNNVSYIRWIEDVALSNEFSMNSLRINYLAEALCGEAIDIAATKVGNQTFISGMHEGKGIFSAAIE